MSLTLNIDGGVLHAKKIASLGEVVLGDYANENLRLIVLVPTWLFFDDGGLGHYVFTKTLGERGILGTNEDVHREVGALAEAAMWLREGREVTLASFDWPAELLAALVLVAAGRSAPAAIEEVALVSLDFVWEPDVEIPVSVFAESLRAREASS